MDAGLKTLPHSELGLNFSAPFLNGCIDSNDRACNAFRSAAHGECAFMKFGLDRRFSPEILKRETSHFKKAAAGTFVEHCSPVHFALKVQNFDNVFVESCRIAKIQF